MKPFEKAKFIKANVAFKIEYTRENLAPIFRKRFIVSKNDIKGSKLNICGLGYAYCYINGKKVTEDLFCAPVSNYNKTLWYNSYDVSSLLVNGENVIAVICGNGFFNEEFKTAWDFDLASWRDNPKLILEIKSKNGIITFTDDSWKCISNSFVRFNALRSGEYFDGTLYDPNWNNSFFDDTNCDNAIIDNKIPLGVFRETKCEPIREFETFKPKNIYAVDRNKYVFDFGQNISGYIRLKSNGNFGQKLTIKYSELIFDDGNINRESYQKWFYKESEFQTDHFVCPGFEFTWSPKFTYHGFQYVEIDGIDDLNRFEIESVFVHQAVDKKTTFSCSNESLTKLFEMGQYSCLSNMFYMVTDCPTREKLGWLNDSQMSCEQFYTNFEIENLYRKWLIDVYDAMSDEGALPGIVPTAGWGYNWGNGPLSEGFLFEIPYRTYIHTGKSDLLINSLPYFEKAFSFYKSKENENGFVEYGLGDWASAKDNYIVPLSLVNSALIFKFYNIAALAAKLNNNIKLYEKYDNEATILKKRIIHTFIDESGRCNQNNMSSIAIIIFHELYNDLEPLKIQLKYLVENQNYKHDCGLLGVRCLYEALNKCGLQEYAFKIILSKGFPGYVDWLEAGATTLWEHWKLFFDNKMYNSRNHHMYSDFMSWIIKTVIGLSHNKTEEYEYKLDPYYFSLLDFAKCEYKTENGIISVNWEKKEREIELVVIVPNNISIYYNGNILKEGKYIFNILGDKNENC